MTALALSACQDKQEGMPAMPPPEVTVVTVKPADVPLPLEYVGQTAGSREVEVRARVSGILLKRLYAEGRPVKAGDALYQIDPEQAKAALDQARGALEVEQAKLIRAKQDQARILPLFAENAVSQKDRDEAVANFESAQASVAAARARVREAQINMDYTRVTAPISGMTSKEVRSEGSLVSPSGDASLLTKISQLDPMYVNFSMSDNELLRLRTWQAQGRFEPPEGERYTVEVKLSDGSMFPTVGRLNFTDNLIDPSTGAIRSRAEFANPDGVLLPGQFVRVYLKGGKLKNAMLIPQRAVLSTQQGKLVFVANAQNKAEPRPVELGDEVKNEVIVVRGLQAGDRVIVDGNIKARPGAPVKVVDPTAAGKPAAAPAKGA
ncbi:MAG: efflux RND transporter periplasmic adaptor subunit [Rivihabitans pingtungensis]